VDWSKVSHVCPAKNNVSATVTAWNGSSYLMKPVGLRLSMDFHAFQNQQIYKVGFMENIEIVSVTIVCIVFVCLPIFLSSGDH
jgi:hypothetical protein